MIAGIMHLIHLPCRERLLLTRIRAAVRDGLYAGDAGDQMALAFAELAGSIRAAGLMIAAPANPIVQPDEKSLIAWLTLLQRERVGLGAGGHAPDRRLLPALQSLASLLAAEGMRLDYRNIIHLPETGEGMVAKTQPAAVQPPIKTSERGRLLRQTAMIRRLRRIHGVVPPNPIAAAIAP